MMLDIFTAREGFKDKVISDIGFTRGSTKIADVITKGMAKASLRTVIAAGRLQVHLERRIMRKD